MGRLSETETAAWRGFLSVHGRVWKQLDAELQQAFGLGLPAYESLLTLEEQGELRMTELAQRLRFSSGGLTRLTDRLEKEGLVQRVRCDTDGRSFQVSLTGPGKHQLQRMHVVHLRGVREQFLSHLDDTEQALLGRIWGRMEGGGA
ncbi:MarR family winged helix-turn-helix transcriptional regulator [Deinococcus radiophilus]|uniref:MarR family transcriptional regulator n=1 Tax=Deinococcus radiophilus TaxID=32062 RepID=A0A3S0RF16_9DEIO|nr:MarR family transcriptional regulator [Deinococcus radiophilus]RTR26833.1 MarR family transcriptional regulator [Deinococcus radiophilus]UFA51802.1 MarR family transcriptional regulator [Deinococcus radiophilus]